MINVDIIIEGNDWPSQAELDGVLQKAITATLNVLKWESVTSELSVVFTNDSTIKQLNCEWRGIDKATNVLSFPAFALKVGEQPKPIMGDIVLAFETIEKEALMEKKSFHDHLSHLLIHGILHLLGYDHIDDEEATIMEHLESQILQKLAIADPYQPL